jgi:hypothetical protein
MIPRQRITRGTYEKIELGMTDVEVQAILGPPTNLNNMPRYTAASGGPIRGRSTTHEVDWICNDIMIQVYFDETDRVAGTGLASVRRNPKPFLERLLDCMRIQKQQP